MKRLLAGAGSIVLSAALITVIAPSAHAATTLSVPSRYRTISAAVAAAHSGDTVLVSPGTYRENITISGKNVVLRSTGGPDRTVIAGNAGRSPVMFQNVSRASAISGFKIVSGNAPSGQGGGITVANGASPVIAYNKILSNHSHDGGGILVYNHSNPDIAFNYIQNNSATQFGGGVFAYIASNPVLHNNVISGNRSAGGAGLYMESNSGNRTLHAGGTVTRNTISGNIASGAGGGIMLRTGETAFISGNTITGNRAPYGGGIHVETNGSGPTIAGNVIKSNVSTTSAPGSGSGGGIAVFAQSTPLIQGNTIYGNSSSIFGGGIVLAEGSSSRVVGNNIANNVVTSNTAMAGGGGIFVANSNASIWNNILRANRARSGGGLRFAGTGDWVALNNTLVGNLATAGGSGALGGGLLVGGKTSGKTSIVNNMFVGNNNYQIYDAGTISSYGNNLADASQLGAFYGHGTGPLTSLASLNGHRGIGAGYSNRDGNSAMVNRASGNYRLTRTSSAVDAGRTVASPSNDYSGARRPSGRATDIGAYEFTG